MKPDIQLKKITTANLPQVARVHINSFPDSALTKLGAAIVENYYLWQLTGPHELVWATGAFVIGECAGYSISGVFNGSTSGFIKENRKILIREVLLHPWLMTNRSFFQRLREGVRLLNRARRKTMQPKKPIAVNPVSSFGILSIAVAQKYQKLGIGELLMLDAETEAIKCGFEQMDLSVHPNNRKAVRFYEKLGWTKIPSGDAWKGVMIKNIQAQKLAANAHSGGNMPVSVSL